MSQLKLVFAGTPEFAAQHLSYLLESNINISAVYSQPDRPAGRGKKLQASPVKQVAEAANIPVYQPINFKNPEDIQTLAELKPDLLIVVAYGLLLPKAVLDIPRLGCINVHASLLPRFRGAAPIERAIESGDSQTGVTIMQMDIGLDTGDMLSKTLTPISADETGDSLRQKLAACGCKALLKTLTQLQNGAIAGEVQDDSKATYAHKLQKTEAQIDWQQDAPTLALKIRAFNSSNVCFSTYQEQRIKIWQASAIEQNHQHRPGQILAVNKQGLDIACGQGLLRLTQIQLPNSKAMNISDLLNGRADLFSQGSQFV